MLKQITRSELVSMCQRGEKFTLVDVLNKESFAKEHIPGALSLPLAEIEAQAGQVLRKHDKIVVYCASFQCMASTAAAEKLMAMGYENVLDYKGGLQDYKEGGLSLQGSLHEGRVCASCCACD